MTAKEYVKKIFPKAYSERYVYDGSGVVFFFIWIDGMRIGEGSISSKAWQNAKNRILKSRQK